MLPACFSISKSHHHQNPQNNLITCTYQTHLPLSSPILLTLTWSKSHSSHSLTLHSPLFSFTISLSSSPSFFLLPRPTSKSIKNKNRNRLKLYWDFNRAIFATPNSAEPDSSFYVAVVCDDRLQFLIGDLKPELTRRAPRLELSRDLAELSSLVSRREHVFGKRSYVTRARFCGAVHEIEIECSGGAMKVRIDGRTGLVVKRLGWKFRGNERIFVGGLEVDFFWDVFNWVSNNGDGNGRIGGGGKGCGMFVFQVGEGGGVSPEMVGPEKKFFKKRLSESASPGGVAVSPAPSWSSSVWQWAEESSDCGRSSCSNSSAKSCYGGSGGGGGGFSLVLYAWRRD